MNDLTLRTAEDKDTVAIESVINQWIDWRGERAASMREALDKEDHEILVAEVNSKIIGVLHLMFYPDILFGDHGSHIILFLVDKEHRGKGVGSKLMEKATERSKERGAVEIHVDTIYPEAERFYRKRGFKDDGIMLSLALSAVHE